MAPALTAAEYIYEGVWVNWSKGRVFGSTLTVSPQHASILSPALAVLISIAGGQLWRLFQFALHQARATSNSRNFIYHQSQSILRNTSSDLNALWRFLRLAVAWRHQRDAKVLRSLLPLVVWTLIHLSLVVTVGLLSSWLLEANDEVLSRSPWCGTFNKTYYAEVYSTNQTDAQAVSLMKEYSSYTDSRYVTVQSSVDICHDGADGCISPRDKALAWTSTFIAKACPVNSTLCHPDAGGSTSFDTGLLSSHKDLGYNARKEDRVSIRLAAQCAPLKAEGFVTDWQYIPAASGMSAREAVDARYGPGRANARNSTYTLTRQQLECDERTLAQPYSLTPYVALPGGSPKQLSATFTPISELRPTDRDLTLVLMSFNNVYEGPVLDPWFSAQQAVNVSAEFCLKENTKVYTREHALTAMACGQQWQICNTDSDSPDADQCTPLQGIAQVNATVSASNSTMLSARQLATAQRLIRAATGSTFHYVIYALSQSMSPPLKARNKISYNVGPVLPQDQWRTETAYWMELVVAYFQQANLDYSTGQFAASTSYINVSQPSADKSSPSQDAAHWLCESQIIRSTNYRNFNFFALLLAVTLCALIIVAGLSIEDLTNYVLQRSLRYSGSNGKQNMWIANSDLDMLRKVDELRNGTTWTVSRNGVPLTHVSHTVSINDLMTDRHDVEKGTGIVVPSVKRHKETASSLRWGPYKHTNHSGHKRCATCSTLEVSPSDSSPQISRSGTSAGDGLINKDLAFHNTFQRSFSYDLPAEHQPLPFTFSAVPQYSGGQYRRADTDEISHGGIGNAI